jgi:rRNA maturation endonuclease Nob1
MARSYYDDNFGFYDIRDEEDVAFYHEMQKRSVWKKCQRCRRRVKLAPDYGICNSCCEQIERGGDY